VPLHGGLRDRVFGVAPGAWDLWRCTACGAARLDPRPADSALAALYAAGSYYTHEPPHANIAPGGLAGVLRALRNAHVNARLGYRVAPAWRPGAIAGRLAPPLAAIAERGVRSLPAGERLLDVGCGNGQFVAEAAAAGWRASGIDVDATAVAAGRAAGLDLAVETVQERAAREPGAFDAVTLSHVIEHVADPVGFLRATLALLRPGGHAWIATPNLGSLGHRRYGADWMHLDPPRHLVLFDHAALRRALTAAGFAEIRALRPTPAAGPSFAISAAVARGVCPANGTPPTGYAPRLRALAADAAAQVDRRLGDELLMLATRRAPRSSRSG
jgi:2-polyprenyl-3-methyl-5-hydroxy-6-metoxy-1,4-benzoquinol methylase